MRRTAFFLAAAAAAASFAAPAAASVTCRDVAGVPGTGFGPVCTVQCVAGGAEVNPKDVKGTVIGLLTIVCPA